jgi:hypothetical protein
VQVGVALLQAFAATRDRSAGADAGHQHVDLAARLVPDLLGRRAAVDLGVRGVRELVGDVGVVAGAGEALGSLDRLVHPAHRLGDLDLGAVHLEERLALTAHALGHGQDQLVAARRAHEGERDPGVAGGGLDDRGPARLDAPVALGGVDHRHADPVLDAAGRVVGLELAEQLGAALRRDAGEPDHRGAADDVGQVRRKLHA